MKRVLFILTTCLLILSCGNNDQAGMDNHSAHGTENHAEAGTDTSTSMMALMHKMDRDMQQVSLTNDPDIDFATMMRVHHQSAIEMINLELAKGSDTAVKRMAEKMKVEQMREIESFDRFLQTATKKEASERFATEFKGTIKAMDHSNHAAGNSIDSEFINMMVPHHEGAIDMAQVYLKFGKNEELLQIARQIIQSQAEEVVLLKSLNKDGHQH